MKDYYGQNHNIFNANTKILNDLLYHKSNPDSLRYIFGKLQCCRRRLESEGTDYTTYGTILAPMIYNKLQANTTRDKGDNNWDLRSLKKAVKKELCVQDARQANNLRSSQKSQEFTPTANSVAGSSHKKIDKPENSVKLCLFCNGNHSPTTDVKKIDHCTDENLFRLFWKTQRMSVTF